MTRRAILIELTPAEYGAVQAESFEQGKSRRALVKSHLMPWLVQLVAKHSDRLGLPLASDEDDEG